MNPDPKDRIPDDVVRQLLQPPTVIQYGEKTFCQFVPSCEMGYWDLRKRIGSLEEVVDFKPFTLAGRDGFVIETSDEAVFIQLQNRLGVGPKDGANELGEAGA